MSPAKLQREAEVAIVAFYRAMATEGDFVLTKQDLAQRVGKKLPNEIDHGVIDHLGSLQWIDAAGAELRITKRGQEAAAVIISRRQKARNAQTH